MRWFKHLTDSWHDEKLASLVSDHGLEIYGFWWRILEIIGKQMDGSERSYCQYSAKTWGKFAGVSAKKFQKLAGILSEKDLISYKNGGGEIKIGIPKMLKYRDEWTRRKANEVPKTPE
jgi:hypothetical protein